MAKNPLARPKSAGAQLRAALRTKKQKALNLTMYVALGVFFVCGLLAAVIPEPSFTAAYLIIACGAVSILTAAWAAISSTVEGKALRASMRRIEANGGEEAALAELRASRRLCGGPIRLSERWLFAEGMAAAAPLAALKSMKLEAKEKKEDVFVDVYAEVEGEKKPVLVAMVVALYGFFVMREDVGYVNRGVAERSAEFLQGVIANGGKLPEKTAQSAEKDPKLSRASAKETRALLALLTDAGLPEEKTYALYLRRKEAPEAGGLLVERTKEGRMRLSGETELVGDELIETEAGAYELSREKTAALGRELADLSFVLAETDARGRVKVYRITPEQLLQVDKYLAETGRY